MSDLCPLKLNFIFFYKYPFVSIWKTAFHKYLETLAEVSHLLRTIDGYVSHPFSEQIIKIIIFVPASLGGMPVELRCRKVIST